MKLIDYTLEDIYFLEAIKCYPKDRKYLKGCSNNCRKYLIEQLFVINPQIILTLGDIATRTLLNIKYSKFGDVAGKCYDYNGFEVIPIYNRDQDSINPDLPVPESPSSGSRSTSLNLNLITSRRLLSVL